MTDEEIQHGDRVRDRISGMEGIVINITRHLTGCDRFGVRPQSDSPDRRDEDEYFSDGKLEIVDRDAVSVDAPSENIDVSLGDQVRDTVTGKEGTVTILGFESFNCPRAYVTTRANSDSDDGWVDVPRLTIVQENVADFDDLQDNDEVTETGSVHDYERSPTL